MKVVTNSVLTVVLDDLEDHDFLVALGKVAKRDNVTLEKVFERVVSDFLSTGGSPPLGFDTGNNER